MKLFWEYLYGHRRALVLFCGFCAVFTVSFCLYQLPVGAVVYPLGLCLLAGILFVVFDFERMKRRRKALEQCRTHTPRVESDLPEADHPEEASFRAVAVSLMQRLRTAENAAEEKYRGRIGYFTAWAHQVKTPIASMRLTLANEDSPLSRRLTGETERMERYVEMALTYLRLDSENSDFVLKRQDMDDLMRSSIRAFSGDFIEKKLKLEYTPLCMTAVTDEKWFCFAAEQILSNAVKYTPEGGTVTVARDGEYGIRITDTGIGIAPEDLPRIFENAYTGQNGRIDRRATGIGLYLCRRICDRLGIALTVTSTVGVGTSVLMTLSQYDGFRE